MFKKFIFSLFLLLFLQDACMAGNLNGAKLLMNNGFRLIENENLFMIKSKYDNLHPFIRIEKLPAHFDITLEVKNECLKKLNDLKVMFAQTGKSEIMDKMFNKMEDSIASQKQYAYKFDMDVNFDGVADTFICPDYEFLKFSDDWKGYGIRKFYSILDQSMLVKIPVKQKWLLSIGDSPLMPLFKESEFNIYDKYREPNLKRRSSFTLESYPKMREYSFVPTKLKLVSNEDGNLTVILIDEKTSTANGPESISLKTNFRWE